MRRPSGTCATPARTMASGRARVIALSSSVISPPVGRTSPDTAVRRVVLPAPLEPMRATISRARTWIDAVLMAWTMP